MTNRQPARFTGIQIYPEPDGLYRFRYALNWHVFPIAGQPDGILVSPEAENPKTWLAVWKQKLSEKIQAPDFSELRKGLDEGLRTVGSDAEIIAATEERIGDMVRFERIVTFVQDGKTCKRRVWLIYSNRWQISLVYHAESIEAYEYWLGMANYSFATFEPSELLYFATDTESNKATNAVSVPQTRRRKKHQKVTSV